MVEDGIWNLQFGKRLIDELKATALSLKVKAPTAWLWLFGGYGPNVRPLMNKNSRLFVPVQRAPALAREKADKAVVDKRDRLMRSICNPIVAGDNQLASEPLVNIRPIYVLCAGRNQFGYMQKLESVVPVEAVHHVH